MSITEYLESQGAERRRLMQSIHEVILNEDQSVEASLGTMMGKPMIIYNNRGFFKYGLAGVKEYMSLHLTPIYGSHDLCEKYRELLPRAKFQKGCINFRNGKEISLDVITQLLKDCALIDLLAMRQEYLKSKQRKGHHI